MRRNSESPSSAAAVSSAAYADPASPIASCRQPERRRRRTRGFVAAKVMAEKVASVSRTDHCTGPKNMFSQPRVHEQKTNYAVTSTPPKSAQVPDLAEQEDEEAERGHEEAQRAMGFYEFDPYIFIKCLPDYKAVTQHLRRPVVLPKKTRRSKRISLVLDLDETLVHCSIEPLPNPDLVFQVPLNGNTYTIFVLKRPYMDEFLREVAKHFEVIVFTASRKAYASKLLDLIDPGRRLIKYRLYRETCLQVEGNYLKDLNVLGRDLAHTVIVDNSPHAFGYQVSNGIPIESWFDDSEDTELVKLLPFLAHLFKAEDVRPAIRRKFQLHRLVEMAGTTI